MARRRNSGTANGSPTNPSRNSPPGSSIRSAVCPRNSTKSKGRAAHEESSSSRRAQACRSSVGLAESEESGDGTSRSTGSPSHLPREIKNSRSSQTFSNESVESTITECVGRKHGVSAYSLLEEADALNTTLDAVAQFCGKPDGVASRGFSPIFLMREIRVVGFTPRSSAAPSAPLIFQPVFCRTIHRLSRSRR